MMMGRPPKYPVVNGQKICLDCEVEKPVEQFRKRVLASTTYSCYCKTCHNARSLAAYKANRLKAIAYYSQDTNRCACCNESALEFLALDHIDGGGNKHRKELSGKTLSDWVVRNGFPEGFRVLCHNCNIARGMCGYCPHEIERLQCRNELNSQLTVY